MSGHRPARPKVRRVGGSALLGTWAAGAAVTLALTGRGDRDRWRERPWIPLLLGGKVLADVAGAAALFAEQVTRHHRVCSWRTLAAVANTAAVPAAWPEARAAWRAPRAR